MEGTRMFTERKAGQMAAYLLRAAGASSMNLMKLVKLMYLADRACLDRHERSISNNAPFSMDFGPVLSNTLNLLRGKRKSADWESYISKDVGHSVGLADESLLHEGLQIGVCFGKLSRAEIKILEEVHSRYGHMNEFDLSEYTHKLPEWKNPHGSSIPIKVETILLAVGKSRDAIDEIAEEIREREEQDRALAAV
jgi:uncharacterized phage-associated protein